MNGVRTLNDGSSRPPRLKPFLNLGSIQNLRNDSSWPDLEGIEALTYLKEQGIEGVRGCGTRVCGWWSDKRSGRSENPCNATE
jgi:hypothetical protein